MQNLPRTKCAGNPRAAETERAKSKEGIEAWMKENPGSHSIVYDETYLRWKCSGCSAHGAYGFGKRFKQAVAPECEARPFVSMTTSHVSTSTVVAQVAVQTKTATTVDSRSSIRKVRLRGKQKPPENRRSYKDEDVEESQHEIVTCPTLSTTPVQVLPRAGIG